MAEGIRDLEHWTCALRLLHGGKPVTLPYEAMNERIQFVMYEEDHLMLRPYEQSFIEYCNVGEDGPWRLTMVTSGAAKHLCAKVIAAAKPGSAVWRTSFPPLTICKQARQP
jgi:hypothetical protein